MKKIPILLLATGLIFCLPQFLQATPFTYTYTDSGEGRWPGNDVLYTLTITPADTSSYEAHFTIASTLDTFPEWYAGWFLFKFDGAGGAPISDLSPNSGWTIFNGEDVWVLGGGGKYKPLQPSEGGFTGFYLSSLTNNSNDFTDGVLLTVLLTGGTSSTFTFKFTIPPGSSLNLESIPFKAGYYAFTKKEVPEFNQLSESLAVREPATMFLLGSGLIGVAVFVRRRFRN